MKETRRLFLDDPQTIWLVKTGEVDIFAVPRSQAVGSRARHYLFSCTSGEALLGSLPILDYPWVLLAIGDPEAELCPVSSDTLEEIEVEPMLSLWIGHLRQALTTYPLHHPLPDRDRAFTLEDLPAQHQHLFQALEELAQQGSNHDRWRFQQRQQFNQQVLDDALSQLAALNHPSQANPISVGEPMVTGDGKGGDRLLIHLVRVIGQFMGSHPPEVAIDRLGQGRDRVAIIALASNLRSRRVLLSDRWWQQDCGPLLAYTRQDQMPVAVLPLPQGGYEIYDPRSRLRQEVTTANHQLLSPSAHTFYRPLPSHVRSLLHLLRFGFQGTQSDLWTLLWTGLAGIGLGILTPQAMAILIDHAIPQADRAMLWQTGLGLVAAAIGGTVFQLIQGFTLMRLETKVEAKTQIALVDRLLKLNIPFFRQYTSGDLRLRLSALMLIRRQLGGALLRTLLISAFALLNLLILAWYSLPLSLVAVAVAVVLSIGIAIATYRVLKHAVELQSVEGKIFGMVVQLLNSTTKLRVSGAEHRAFAHWSKAYGQQQGLKLQLQAVKDHLMVLNQSLPLLSTALLFVALIPLWKQRSLSLGTFLAFQVAFASFLLGITTLSTTAIEILVILLLGKRATPLLQPAPEVDEHKTDPGELSGEVSLEHVTFTYRPGGPNILSNISLTIHPGEFVALVGPSGSGKSTIFRLLLGFETPQSGQILYDGQDLRSLNIQAVRRQLGVLLQVSRTTTASIFENIAGNALITMEEAWDAAQAAGLADDISAMPMGMHTVVSEGGSNLSGGQRQRLLIARALALKPRILMFDEATSALDNHTQAIVSESLARLNVTRLVVAHRLTTVQHADQIYVLQSGQIVQQGTFQQLVQQEGAFKQLMRQQL